MQFAFKSIAKPRQRQTIGLIIGLFVSAACLSMLLMPGQERFHAAGPMNSGHEMVNCNDCHQPAPGTVRQQLQANTRALLGLRKTSIMIGYQPVGNATCLDCHIRSDDTHPVFRFLEPRFSAARAEIQPQNCVSCHQEHTGKRVTIAPTFCVQCHQETKLKNDPLTVSHEQLIAGQQWQTCLVCHDFHGNHTIQPNTVVSQTVDMQTIMAYFAGGQSPYPGPKIEPARKERSDAN